MFMPVSGLGIHSVCGLGVSAYGLSLVKGLGIHSALALIDSVHVQVESALTTCAGMR